MKLLKDKKGNYELLNDNNTAKICPYRRPVVEIEPAEYNSAKKTTVTHFKCKSNCALFKVEEVKLIGEEKAESAQVFLGCSPICTFDYPLYTATIERTNHDID